MKPSSRVAFNPKNSTRCGSDCDAERQAFKAGKIAGAFQSTKEFTDPKFPSLLLTQSTKGDIEQARQMCEEFLDLWNGLLFVSMIVYGRNKKSVVFARINPETGEVAERKRWHEMSYFVDWAEEIDRVLASGSGDDALPLTEILELNTFQNRPKLKEYCWHVLGAEGPVFQRRIAGEVLNWFKENAQTIDFVYRSTHYANHTRSRELAFKSAFKFCARNENDMTKEKTQRKELTHMFDSGVRDLRELDNFFFWKFYTQLIGLARTDCLQTSCCLNEGGDDMQTNDRNVASFIQDMLHLKPHEKRELQHPLAFLLPQHEVKVGLTRSGHILNKALQGYKRGLLGNLTEKIANRDQMVQRFRGDDILVVVSDSGTGKTFLLARTVALLLNKRRAEGQQNLVPNLAFSQLKSRQHRHQRHNNLVDAVLSSTHLSSAPNDIDAFREGVGVERMQPGHQPTVPDIIMFIDSLDEVEKKLQLQLHEADRRLREKGILPIWAMRRLEFAHLESKIQQLDVENLINTDGGSNQIAIELDLTSDLETEIKQLLHGHQHVVNADEETQRAIEEYLKTALSKYQLLHKPRTHLASNLSNDGRKHLFRSLLNGLIEGYVQISADFGGRFPRDPHAWKSIYGQDPNLQNQLYKSNLCFRIIDRFLEELKAKIDWFSGA